MGETISRWGVDLSKATKNLIKIPTTPTTPTPPEAVAPATTGDPAVQQVVAEGTARRSKAKGYRSTILSQNFLSPDNAALKTTLGS